MNGMPHEFLIVHVRTVAKHLHVRHNCKNSSRMLAENRITVRKNENLVAKH